MLFRSIAYQVKNEAISNSKIEELSQFMTDDLGPRLAASQMKIRSEEMVVNKLKDMGFSNPRAEYATEFTKGGWDNEKKYVAMLAPYYCSFAANPKAWSGSTSGLIKGECVLVDIKSEADLEKYKGKLAGKIVLMPITQTYDISFEPLASRYTDEQLAELAKDGRPSGNRRRPPVGVDYRAMMELQRKISEGLKNENPLAIVSGSGTFNVASSRGVQYKVGDPEPTPEIILPIEDHNRMVRMISKGEQVEMEMDIKNTFTDNQKINNVVAEILGKDSKLKDEIVMIGATLYVVCYSQFVFQSQKRQLF